MCPFTLLAEILTIWIEPLRGGPRSSNGGRLAQTPASITWEGMEMSIERDERVRELLQQALSLLGEHEEVKEPEAAPEVAAPVPAETPTETPTQTEGEAVEPVPGPEVPEAPQAEVIA